MINIFKFSLVWRAREMAVPWNVISTPSDMLFMAQLLEIPTFWFSPCSLPLSNSSVFLIQPFSNAI